MGILKSMSERLLKTNSGRSEAQKNLGKYFDELPLTPGGRLNTSWEANRASIIERYGPDAIASLIPAKINVKSVGVTTLVNNLLRGNVRTIFDLVNTNLEDYFMEHRGVGTKLLGLAQLLKEVAVEEVEKRNDGEWSI